MVRYKRVLNFRADNTTQVIGVLEALSKLDIDVVADFTPSSLKVTVYGTKDKIREVSRKIISMAKQSKSTSGSP